MHYHYRLKPLFIQSSIQSSIQSVQVNELTKQIPRSITKIVIRLRILIIKQRLSLPVNSRFRLDDTAEERVATVISRAGGIE